MSKDFELYTQLKVFIAFDKDDVERLRSLAPLFAAHGAAITDEFYRRLLATPETAPLIENRVEQLKQTHVRWLNSLLVGEYEQPYFEERWRIGMTHVRVGIPPWWVEAVTSFLREAGAGLITREFPGPEGVARSQSFLKILDVDLWIINLAYNDERLARLSNFTGMSRKLIERCVLQGT